MDTERMRLCAPLLPEPWDKGVVECLDEIERLRERIEELENQEDRFSDLMEKTSYRIDDMSGEVDKLESDCLTLALRLCGEDENTFAPETREVMNRWRQRAVDYMNGVKE